MRVQMLKLILALVLSTAVTSCTSKNPEKVKNETEKSQKLVEKVSDNAVKGNEATPELEKLAAEVTSLEGSKNAGALVSMIKTLSEKAFQDKVPGSVKYLGLLNRSMISLAKVDKAAFSSGENLVSIKRYIKELSTGCNELQQGCAKIFHFANDMHSTTALMMMADVQTNESICSKATGANAALKEYYCILNIAFEIRSRVPDQNLSRMYLMKSADYAKVLKQESASGFDRFQKTLQLIVMSYDFNSSSDEDKKILEIFAPWNFSELDNADLKNVLRKATANETGSFVYVKGTETLNPAFKEAIEKTLDAADITGKSFRTKVTEITQSPKLKQILVDLDVDLSVINQDYFNEYFYIVDRQFRDHLSSDSAANIWKQTKMNTTQLIKIVDMYIKVELLYKTFETQKFMKTIFESKDSQRSNSIVLMIERSKEMSNEWVILMGRVEKIRDFMIGHVQTAYESSAEIKKLIQTMQIIRRNLKMITTGPMTMLMAHFFAIKDAKIVFYDWYGQKVEIDSQTILNLFYDVTSNKSKLGTWLKFGNDSSDLNLAEMVYSFTYAVLTQTFETFGAKDFDEKPQFENDASRIKFLEVLVEKVLTPYKLNMQSYRDLLNVDNGFADSVSKCEAIKRGEVPASHNIGFEELGSYIAYGGEFNGAVKPISQLYHTIVEKSTLYRADEYSKYKSQLMFVESLIEIAKREATRKISKSEALAAYNGRLDKILAPFAQLESEIYSKVLGLYKRASNCVSVMYNKERELQVKFLAAERAHLESVFDDMTALQKLPENKQAEGVNALKTKYGFTDRQDLISDKQYRMSKFDYFRRMEKFVTQIGFGITKSSDDLISFYSTPQYQFLPYAMTPGLSVEQAKAEFVKNGLKAVAAASLGTVWNAWIEGTSKNMPLVRKAKAANLLMLIQFYNEKIATDSKVQALSMSEYVGAYRELLQNTRLSADDMTLLRIFESRTKFLDVNASQYSTEKVANLDGLFLTKGTEEQRYVLDSAFEELSRVVDVKKITTDYYLAVKHMGDFLFKPAISVEAEVLNPKYKPLYPKAKKLIEAFVAETKKDVPAFLQSISINDGSGNLVIPLYYSDVSKNALQTYGRSNTDLLSPLLLNKYQQEQEQFHKSVPAEFFGN